MLVSLFSDASICNQRKVGGWAAWLKCDRGSLRTGNFFRTTVNDTTIAEAMAVVNGLVAGASTGVIQRGDIILIQTDNNAVMSVLEGTARRKATKATKRRRKLSWSELKRDVLYQNKEIELISTTFLAVSRKYQLTIKWRHVKAHTRINDARSSVNKFCDKIAKNHMRTARKRPIEPRVAA